MLTLLIALLTTPAALSAPAPCGRENSGQVVSRLSCTDGSGIEATLEIRERPGCQNTDRFQIVYLGGNSLMSPAHGPFEDVGGGMFFRNRKAVEDYLLIDHALIQGSAPTGGLKEVHFSSAEPKHKLLGCRRIEK